MWPFNKKKEEILPKLPDLYLNVISLDPYKSWFFWTYEDYTDKSDGKSMYEEDLETLTKWREENPNWDINPETLEIYKK